MNKEIPKYHETFNPILDILSNGEIIHRNNLFLKAVEKYYSELTDSQLSVKTSSGAFLVKDRIDWGKSYLKQAGYLDYPQRGYLKITEKGLNHKGFLSLRKVQENIGKKISTSIKIKSNDLVENVNFSPQDLIDKGFNEIENEVKNELLEKLKTIDPFYFEKVILILLKKMGYGDFIETSKTGDGGIDGIINEDKLGLDKIYIQAKRFNENKVREKDIRNFIGAMSGDTNKGVFVTTSIFDSGAIEKTKNAHHKIILIDGNKLVDLMHEFNVGIQVKAVYEIKQLDQDFFEEE